MPRVRDDRDGAARHWLDLRRAKAVGKITLLLIALLRRPEAYWFTILVYANDHEARAARPTEVIGECSHRPQDLVPFSRRLLPLDAIVLASQQSRKVFGSHHVPRECSTLQPAS
jgi:hypothetical protein